MKSKLLIGVVLAATAMALAAVIALGAPEPSGAAPAGKVAGEGATVRGLWVRISDLEKMVRQLQAERDLLKRENARLIQAEKDRSAPEPITKPGAKPVGKASGKAYFVPDRDEAWWTDLAAFARDVRRRLVLGEDDPDQALPAWLARLGGLAGTEVEWTVGREGFSIQSILPEECLRRAEEAAELDARPAFLKRPAFEKGDGKAEAAYSAAVQTAWAEAAKSHGARWLQIQVGPCAISMLLPVDALLEIRGQLKGGSEARIIGHVVAVRGHEAGLEVFVGGTVSAAPSEKPVAK